MPKPSAITFFVDRLDFIPENIAKGRYVGNAPGLFWALDAENQLKIDIRIIGMYSKNQAPIWVKAFLGLVDGECWLHSRFLRLRDKTGQSIDERGVEFSQLTGLAAEIHSMGVERTFEVLEELAGGEDKQARLARQIKRYSRYWMRWIEIDRWVLNGNYFSDYVFRDRRSRSPNRIKPSKSNLPPPKFPKWLN